MTYCPGHYYAATGESSRTIYCTSPTNAAGQNPNYSFKKLVDHYGGSSWNPCYGDAWSKIEKALIAYSIAEKEKLVGADALANWSAGNLDAINPEKKMTLANIEKLKKELGED